jgi:hypothetical protein
LIAAYYDSSTLKFQIATVNFSTAQIKYQETLPNFADNTIRRVVFVSDTQYFAAANLKTMNDNIGTSAQTVHATYSHGLIFSSDTTNACYQLSASSPGAAIPMSSASIGSDSDWFTTISGITI